MQNLSFEEIIGLAKLKPSVFQHCYRQIFHHLEQMHTNIEVKYLSLETNLFSY